MAAVDLILAVVLIVSGLLAMMRGFALELASILAFALAALAALLALPVVRPIMDGLGLSPFLTLVASLGLIFVGTLVPLWYAGDRLAHMVSSSRMGMFDRVAGFGFGLLRGLFVLAIAYVLIDGFTGSGSSRPRWLDDRHSVLMPLVRSTGALVLKIAPEVAKETRKFG